ncbi:DNA repair protein Rad26 [Trichophyton equinum CBS 127.97]|uniref:DNA repair protein Rad26 n=1 Tax=Trichophyton equinum (strain ATCC MYA-4606 / CBS 127.97) TaxID=559882 RepID=F2PRK4_TRIEC|nr:DNA repair protein Rad26 [Trichophyton equinum CBS 127.97]
MEDDNFWDDGVDDSAYDALLELEQDAYQTTQQAAVVPPSIETQQQQQLRQQQLQQLQQHDQPASRPVRPSLLRHSTSNTLSSTVEQRRRRRNPTQHLRPALSFGETDYQQWDASVLDKDDGLDLVDEQDALLETPGESGEGDDQQLGYTSTSLAPGQWRRITADEPGVMVEPMQTDGLQGSHADTSFHTHPFEAAHVEELKDQIEQLTRERERLAQELAAATASEEARAGEIAIIRANQVKLEKNHNRQISALKSAMEEETRKYRAEIEAALMESKRLVAENGFLKHDLQEETYRASKLQHSFRSKPKDDKPHPATPRKTKSLPLRDGFDDDELMVSPSKSAGRRSKRGTPMTSNKRKRAVDDSPVPLVLQLSQSLGGNADDNGNAETPGGGEGEAPEESQQKQQQQPKREDRNMRYMRLILNHRTYPRNAPDMEVFSSMYFPSEPDRKFSSIVIQSITAQSSSNYAVDYTKAIASLWSRSLKEHFHSPIGMFMSIVKFILHLDLHKLAPCVIESIVPVLQNSGYINGVPRFTSSPVSHENLGKVKRTPQKKLDHRVSSTEALEILYLIVSGCQQNRQALELFWRCVGYDFILIMLNSYQQLNDIILTLKILACGQLANTFGPICDSESQQLEHEKYIIDRAANLLSELPSSDEGEEPYTAWEITTLRVEVMLFLNEIAFSIPNPERNRLGKMIASHPSALARAFRSMHDELDAMYSNPPERDLHATLVNGLTRFVYGIIKLFPGQVDLPSRLRAVPGAVQKHLVVLTRLAFSEGLLLEAGISDQTVEMAHELLEEAINPQEAEALVEAFRSSKADE